MVNMLIAVLCMINSAIDCSRSTSFRVNKTFENDCINYYIFEKTEQLVVCVHYHCKKDDFKNASKIYI